jgi:hypothetical protein
VGQNTGKGSNLAGQCPGRRDGQKQDQGGLIREPHPNLLLSAFHLLQSTHHSSGNLNVTGGSCRSSLTCHIVGFFPLSLNSLFVLHKNGKGNFAPSLSV